MTHRLSFHESMFGYHSAQICDGPEDTQGFAGVSKSLERLGKVLDKSFKGLQGFCGVAKVS